MRILYTILFSVFFLLEQANDYKHLIIYDQCFSIGHQSWPPLSTTAVPGNNMILTQVWSNFGNTVLNELNPIIADVGLTTASLPKNHHRNNYTDSPFIPMANHIQFKKNNLFKFIETLCDSGGRTIEELSKEHNCPVSYAHYTNAIRYASTILNNIQCPAIIWMLGDYNFTVPKKKTGLTSGSRPTSDKVTFKLLMFKLIENTQSDVMKKYNQTNTLSFITYLIGAQYTRRTYLTIGMAQLEASNEYHDGFG